MSYTSTHEEPWTDEIEEYCRNQISTCILHVDLNDEAGYHFKRKRVLWGLPGILIPIIMASVSLMVGWSRKDTCVKITAADYVNSIGYLIVGVVNGVYGFFNFGTKSAKCFATSLMYASIKSQIDQELHRGKLFRIPADVFMTKIGMLMDNAAAQEEVIPESIIVKYAKPFIGKTDAKSRRALAELNKVSRSGNNSRVEPGEIVSVPYIKSREIISPPRSPIEFVSQATPSRSTTPIKDPSVTPSDFQTKPHDTRPHDTRPHDTRPHDTRPHNTTPYPPTRHLIVDCEK